MNIKSLFYQYRGPIAVGPQTDGDKFDEVN